MNILTALFGQKKLPIPSAGAPRSEQWYLSKFLESVRSCESVSELIRHTNDSSGYVREAAIGRCVQLAWPELLPAVAGRLNDWVTQVRQAARSGLMTLLPVTPTPQLLTTMPHIHRLLDAGRSDHAEWVLQFELNLIRHVEVQEIIAGARGTDVKVARSCFLILKNHNLLDSATLVGLILNSREDIVLAIRAIHLCANLPLRSQRVQYGAAVTSHFGAVRTIALRALLSLESEPDKTEIAVAALFDVQSSVRSIATAYLQTKQFDVRAHYRDALQDARLSAKPIQVGLMSLASLRNLDDIVFVKTFAKASFPLVRLAALAAWFKLAPNDKDLIAVDALMDEAPGVRKFALQAVRKYGAYIPFALVRATLEEKGDAPLFLLFSESSKWDWLECIARMSLKTANNGDFESRLVDGLKTWLRRAGSLYDTPSAEQIAFLSSGPTKDVLNKLLSYDENSMKLLDLELQTSPASNSKNR